ncbi:NAD(P)H-hydrate dehydratase [Cohnella cellulosilytica]|uniref:Bifunctional NAD(P)H-hydrate repair enzyme n=1 Tax=Cohnella cellulosilytica TaxID=986710 RepID=A0ABW2FH76_9BACL
MYLVTAEEMRRIDRYAIETIGIPAMALMENAGRAVADEVEKRQAKTAAPGGRPPRWLVLAGKGNNGGDGLVCARHLADRGYEVRIVYAVPPDTLTGEAALQRDIALRIGLAQEAYSPGAIDWERWDGIVDALLGTGTSGAPREPMASLIREANGSKRPIVAIDVPSGLDSDTGAVAEPCIRASVTVALALPKIGLLAYPGADAAGEVVVRAIGIPEAAVRSENVRTFVLAKASLRDRFDVTLPLARKANSHKGTYGHALIVAGSRGMSGAGLLCTRAALRAGCGLVTWAVPEAMAASLTGSVPEAMLFGAADAGLGEWRGTSAGEVAAKAAGKQAVVAGPGLGRWPGDTQWLHKLWHGVDAPLVLDADALNMVAEAIASGEFAVWGPRKAETIVTPHPGEMARLCGESVAEIERDRLGAARGLAARYGLHVVLKGARTVVASPNGTAWVNTTGNAGMATGGAGDVLAGIVGSLLAQGFEAEKAAAVGVYWHGAAGDLAAAGRSSIGSLLAGDIVEAL